jgi:hypothetical protein
MSALGPLLIEVIATSEECACARAVCEARSQGVQQPRFIAVRRHRAVDVDSRGHVVFAWRALMREAASAALPA